MEVVLYLLPIKSAINAKLRSFFLCHLVNIRPAIFGFSTLTWFNPHFDISGKNHSFDQNEIFSQKWLMMPKNV